MALTAMIDQNIFAKVNFKSGKGPVFIGEKILVYRRDNKTLIQPLKIDLPGGQSNNGETPFETYKREVREEFGLDIDVADIIYARPYPSTADPSTLNYFFVARLDAARETEIVFGDEGVEFMLLSPEEYLEHPDVIDAQRERVREYLGTLS